MRRTKTISLILSERERQIKARFLSYFNQGSWNNLAQNKMNRSKGKWLEVNEDGGG